MSPTPLDASPWKWRQSRSDCYQSEAEETWQRLALSSECMWASRPKAARDIYVSSDLSLNFPIPRCKLEGLARGAWRGLRYDVPDLGTRVGFGLGGEVWLMYRTPTTEEAEKAIERTCVFGSGRLGIGFEELRKLVEGRREEGSDEDNAVLLLYSKVGACGVEEEVDDFQIMLYADHLVTDGIGIRILLSKYLSLLAFSMSSNLSTKPPPPTWSKTPKSLSEPWISLLPPSSTISPSPFYTTNQDILLNKIKSNPGLLLLPTSSTHPTQETYTYTLTTAQTTQLLSSTESSLGPTGTITSLLHASMIISLFNPSNPLSPSNPPTPGPKNKILYSPCWFNGRKYLSANQGEGYIPVCMGFHPIIFDDLDDLVLRRGAGKEEVRDRLVRAARVARDAYGMLKELGTGREELVDCMRIFEEIGTGMRGFMGKEGLMTDEGLIGEIEESKERRTADPFLLSDGKLENYISHTYPSSSSSTPMIIVKDIQFAAAAEENIIIRVSSWRKKLRIAGEWRGCDYRREDVVGLIEGMVGILISVIE